MDKIVDLVKAGRIKEVADLRDETDLSGLKLTLDLKRGTDPDKLMQKLFKMTPLEDTFSCNFNVLIAGMPRVMGVPELLLEWVAFRQEAVKRRVYYELTEKRGKLHLLRGLQKILLDIDKAIKIVRETEEEREVIPNLMIGFKIDKTQADYVAEIRLRQLNREHILRRIAEIEELEKAIAEMDAILKDDKKVKAIITSELREVAKKYQKPRKTLFYFADSRSDADDIEEVPAYPVHLFFTREGYFKKITPQSLRMSGENKLKEGDEITQSIESDNSAELLFFTDRQQVYKAQVNDFEDTKAAALGDYIPAALGMDDGENAIYMVVTQDYSGFLLFFFENGKAARVDLNSYETKTRRKKLLKAYSDRSPLAAMFALTQEAQILLRASNTRMLLLHTGAISGKTTRDTQGVAVMTVKKGHRLAHAALYTEGMLGNPTRFMTRTLPAAGSMPREEDLGEQLTLTP